MSFSDAVLRFSSSTSFDGPMPQATHAGQAGVRGEGPFVRIELRIQAGLVTEARYESNACPVARACGAVVCWLACGKVSEKSTCIKEEDVLLLLHDVPDVKRHLAAMAVEALQTALATPITARIEQC